MKKFVTLLLPLTLLNLFLNSLFAQEVEIFEPIEVIDDRLESTSDSNKTSKSTLDREEIQNSNAESIPDLVKNLPNVTPQGASSSGAQSVNIRGLSGNRILQLVDGVRKNINFDFRPSFFLDPNFLSEVEVLKGSSYQTFGSGALGGVISQKTVSASDIMGSDLGLGMEVKTGYETNGNGFNGTPLFAYQNEIFDILGGFSYRYSDIKKQGDGSLLYGSESESYGGLLKNHLYLTENQVLALYFNINAIAGSPPNIASAHENTLQPPSENDLIERNIIDEGVSLVYDLNLNDDSSFSLTAYQNYSSITDDNNGIKDFSAITSYGLTSSYRNQLNKKIKLLLGVDSYLDSYKDGNDSLDMGEATFGTDSPFLLNNGLYAQVIYDIYTKERKLFSFNVSLRNDYFYSNNNELGDYYDWSINPSAGISWNIFENLNVALLYANAFRAPSITEIYQTGIHYSMGFVSNVFAPNVNLKPETSHSFELSTQYKREDTFATSDSISLQATVFTNYYNDFISTIVDTSDLSEYDPFTGYGGAGVTRSENIRNAMIKGLELGLDYNLDALSLFLNFGMSNGIDQDLDDYLSEIPASKIGSGVTYSIWEDGTLGMRMSYTFAQDKISTYDSLGPYDDYTLIDLFFNWTISLKNENSLNMKVFWNNILNQNYRIAWNAVYEEGTSFGITASYAM